VTITGMAKRAAMIGPKMATMLAVVMADAALEPADTNRCYDVVMRRSITSVDGHMSTNDTVLLLAVVRQVPRRSRATTSTSVALFEVSRAAMIPADGEGRRIWCKSK
jgi:glutamate N-acetyltransferase/amino-acid N-acetyltransferase